MNSKKDSTIFLMVKIGLVFSLVIISIILFSQKKYHQEMENIITQKAGLIKNLVKENLLVTSVAISNKKNKFVNLEEINQKDLRWINAREDSEMVQKYLWNKAGIKLKEFQKVHPEFKEIFITDNTGVIVALTNKTTDYYQADEEWWNQVHDSGAYIGKLEYDASAQTWSFPIYDQIQDRDGSVIGIIKAIPDIRALR